MLFNIVNGAVAVPSDDYLIPKTSNTRATNTKNFKQFYSRSDAYKHSFFPSTIKLWNKLSESVINSKTLDQFKANLKPEIDKIFS